MKPIPISLSIIIPVYNSEDFLARCLDSVLKQTLKDIEIILVNDGSKDGSGAICDKYAQKDSRIKVIYQENQGVSAARNNALAIASGDFVGFVDSDDYIHPQMFEKLLATAEKDKSDVVMCDALTVYDDGRTENDTITQLPESTVLEKSNISPFLLLETAGAVWRCIYKKSLLQENQIRFPSGIKFSEDRVFNIYAFGNATKIAYIKEPYYYRYVNLKSAVHRFHNDYFEACKKSHYETQKALNFAWDNNPEYKKAYLSQFIIGALTAINNYYYKTSTLSAKEKRQAVIALCNDASLKEAIIIKGDTNRQERWILNKKYNLLILYAKLANIKYRR